MKIAISSDNHLDVNQVDPAQALAAQAKWLLEQQVGAYFFLGDLKRPGRILRRCRPALARKS
ncbi:hypothetical protein [Limosilactobacillus ingluviei]|uniref:hypothetical protein n=1 Tax=Limosilactobacillus ingluviei TaxID=148604 RepID=UPI00265FED8E|nr:hypothetical protein [Limosilactobacillus ingluviei]